MNRKLNILMFYNTVFHINNFILILLVYLFGLNSIAALWLFTPFISILFTTSMIENSKKILSGTVRKLSIIDFLSRCFILFFNFFALSNLVHIPYIYLFGVGIIFMMINIYVEVRMKKLLSHIQQKDVEGGSLTKEEFNDLIDDYVNDKSSSETSKSVQSIVYMGYSNVLIIVLVIGGIISFDLFGVKNRWIVLLIVFLFLAIYLYLTAIKIRSYYNDKKRIKAINIRDNITLVVGLSIIYILHGVVYIGESTFNFFGIFLACAFFLPTFKTNQAIRSNFYKTNKNKHK
ncbi:hypothetical protein SAMN05421807_12715 [Virgibacillus chiguensis]|uniref:Uncharacterized protein n=1 Tax=Virgibacillus chiguensis TaxID=411959 RepID=A0A1M5XHR9_9BACI|nr:hypothetical protein SAMN05421807_12715 [Virgibacillus chiguensis]